MSIDMSSYEDAYKCRDCDYLSVDKPESPLFECHACGDRFDRDTSADADSNRCPSCNKLGARVADYACPECMGVVDHARIFYSSARRSGAA